MSNSHGDDQTDRLPPHDIAAERALLASCAHSPRVLAETLETVQPDDFWHGPHAAIYTALMAMHAAKQGVTPITLIKYLADNGTLDFVGGQSRIWEITNHADTIFAHQYAEIIVDRALRRSLAEFGEDTARTALEAAGDTFGLVERAVAKARDIRDRGQANADLPTMDILDFINVEDTYNWLIPGLLEHGDRLVLTATEGGGKSTLLRQIAVTTAAGLQTFQPWLYADAPKRVLVLDCENGAPVSRRKFRPLLDAAEKYNQPMQRGMFHIECRPEGLDLTRPADRAWLMRRVEKLKPDLLIIGPIYRLHAGDPNSEELARKVSAVIDEARATANCAVLMEAHAPHHNGQSAHRNLRPLGSSLWMRWPEFGFGLRPVEDEKSASNADGCRGRRFLPWRGMRDERDWPQFIKQGEMWPWTAYRPIDLDPITGHSPTGAIW